MVVKGKVPCYGPLLQTLFNTKLPDDVVSQYELFYPELVGLRSMPEGDPVWPPPSDAPEEDSAEEDD